MVETVAYGSPAEVAGIAVGDVVTAIDGRPLVDPRAVPEIVTSLAGRSVRIDLRRGGETRTVEADLNPATP